MIKSQGNAGNFVDTLSGLSKGDTSFTVSDGSLIQKGDMLGLVEDTGGLVTSNWAVNTLGQMLRVDSVADDTVFFQNPLRMSYIDSLNPRIRIADPTEYTGVECLKVTRKDSTSNQTSNLYYKYARNCHIKGVESYKCNFTHVEIFKSSNLEVTGSYFHHAFGYGGGGQAYGVTLHFTSGECLITNNIFKHLRHSMLMQAGSNGNVLAYNYSADPYWDQSFLPENSAGDLVLHGNYPYANLFEGNIVQNVVVDNSHDLNGPFNTFFRNRAELYGLFMNSSPATDSLNFVGFEITDNSNGQYKIEGSGHFKHGNNVNGTIDPSGTNTLSDTSYYRDEKPVYWRNGISWHSVGIPNELDSGTIPAERRFRNGDILTVCDVNELESDTDSVNSVNDIENNAAKAIAIYPNPNRGK
ncbi:MAG: hypothetical protein ABEH43_10360, partial [Flavobacteriales bacterium]